MQVSPCYPSQVKPSDIDKSLDEGTRKKLLRYVADNYVSKSIGYTDILDDLSKKFDVPRAWIDRAVGSDSAVRSALNDAYIQTRARAFARDYAKLQAKHANIPGLPRGAKWAWDAYRGLKTFLHGPVFPFTHAFDVAKMPTKMGYFWKTVARSWGALNDGFHRSVMSNMIDHPHYAFWKRMGAVIDPKQGPVGILAKGGKSWASKAWDMLKPMRLEIMDGELFDSSGNIKAKYRDMHKADFEEMAKNVASRWNHMTGSVSRTMGEQTLGYMSGATFAPELTSAKWHGFVNDHAKAVSMAAKDPRTWTKVDKQFMGMIARQDGELVAGHAIALGVNAGLLSAGLLSLPGQKKQQINWFDRSRADWMRPKAFGQVYNMRGLDEIGQLMGKLVTVGQYAFGHGDQRQINRIAGAKPWEKATAGDALKNAMVNYAFGKLHPTAEKIKEGITGEDYSGRPLPWSAEQGSKFKPKYSKGEYVAESLSPIFMEGAIKEFYEGMKEKGLDTKSAMGIMRGLGRPLTTGAEEFSGIGVYNEEH